MITNDETQTAVELFEWSILIETCDVTESINLHDEPMEGVNARLST